MLITKDVSITADFETKRKCIAAPYTLFESTGKLCISTFGNESLTLLKQYFL